MADLSDILRETTEAMACFASVDMDLWNRHSNACLQAAAALAEQTQQAVEVKADGLGLLPLIKWAHETLYEIDPSNYDHDEVVKLNDASVEVILGLAQALGEKHGYSADWWAQYRKDHPVATLAAARSGSATAHSGGDYG